MRLGMRMRSAAQAMVVLGATVMTVVVASEWFAPGAIQRVVLDGVIYVAIVVALQMFVGNTGIISFGHMSFFGVGAYAAALASAPKSMVDGLSAVPPIARGLELEFWPALGVAAIVTLGVVAIVGWPLSKMSELPMAMATLAVLVMFSSVFVNWTSMTGGTRGLTSIPRTTTSLSAAFVAVGMVAVALLYRASSLGLRSQAAREDPVAAEALGVDVERARYLSFVLSGAAAGVAGAVWALNSRAFASSSFFFDQTFLVLSMLVVGGLFSVSGAVVGVAIVVGGSTTVERFDDGRGLVPLCIACLMLGVLLLRPDGLVGANELGGRVRESTTRRLGRGGRRDARD